MDLACRSNRRWRARATPESLATSLQSSPWRWVTAAPTCCGASGKQNHLAMELPARRRKHV